MTTSFFILLSIPAVCFAILAILVLCSPRGYQDTTGFHFGEARPSDPVSPDSSAPDSASLVAFPAPQKSSKRVDDDADEPARGRESFCL